MAFNVYDILTAVWDGTTNLFVKAKLQDGSGNAITSTSSALDVNIKSGSSSGTEYADGVTQATPTGPVALGKNPSNVLHTLALDSSGNLNVNVAAGGTSGTQYADGAARSTATGTLAMGDDGTNIQSLLCTTAGVLKVDLTATTANATAVKVDGSAVTQPVSGTVSAAQSGTWTVQPGNTANTTAWKVDGSAVTQPVSGTVTSNQGGAPWSENITQFGSTNISTGTGASGAGIPRVTVANDSNILASQSGTWTVQPGNTANTTAWKVDGSAVTQPVSGTFWQTTQPVSGTVAATQSGTWAVSLPTNAAQEYGGLREQQTLLLQNILSELRVQRMMLAQIYGLDLGNFSPSELTNNTSFIQ